LQRNYELTKNIKETIVKTVSEIKGDYAFIAMFENGQLAAVRFHEPLIIGVGQDNIFLSSDVLGFIEYTDNAIYMKSESFVILDKGKFQILDFDGKDTKYEITKISKEFGDAYKGDCAHFTLKEIYEQPDTILRSGEKTVDAITKTVDYIKHAKNIYITGSGTSYNSALIAKQILSKYAKIKEYSWHYYYGKRNVNNEKCAYVSFFIFNFSFLIFNFSSATYVTYPFF
jgi:glucosamine--fructose-6-phosphate aminotransferase (isomerizing)